MNVETAKREMKTRLLTSLLLTIGVLSGSATPTVTATWSSATTTYEYNDHVWEITDSWHPSGAGARQTRNNYHVVFSVASQAGYWLDSHDSYVKVDTSWECAGCGSDMYQRRTGDFYENYGGVSVSEPGFPIVSELTEVSAFGPSDCRFEYSGTYVTWSVQTATGEDPVYLQDSISPCGMQETVLGARGTDSVFRAALYISYGSDPAGMTWRKQVGYMNDDSVSCSLDFSVIFSGPPESLYVRWMYSPSAVEGWGTPLGQQYDVLTQIHSGQSGGPGAQRTTPLECFCFIYPAQ